MSDTPWIALGAIGSTLGFGVIGWQAFLTAQQGRQNGETLKIAQLIATEAIRARLDGQAPAVTVKLSPPPWEPLAWTPNGMPINNWPHGHTWHFPKDQDGSNRIVLQQTLVAENRSDSRVQVKFDGDLVIPDSGRRPHPAGMLIMEAGDKTAEVYLQRDFTIKELAENYAARQAGQELPHKVTGTVTVDDDRDNGSTDQWNLLLTGCPVEPVPDHDGLWRIVPFHIQLGEGLRNLDYSLLPARQRTHWVSRSQGIKLSDPESA